MTSTKLLHPPVTPKRTVVQHAFLAALMAFIMLIVYLGGFHKPVIKDLDIAIVTEDPAVSVSLQQNLTNALGNGLHVRSLATEDEAKEQLRNREISGAYLPQEGKAKLLLASSGSGVTAETVTKIFQQTSEQQQIPLTIEDVVPSDVNDPIGQNSFFYLVALSVGSYATSIAIAAAGMHRQLRDRIIIAVGAALTIPTVFLITSYWLYGLFDGHLRAAWALSVLYSTAVLFIGVGLRPLVGHYCTLLYATLFVGLNFTSSGGVLSPELQTPFFQTLHQFWIGAGFIEAIRNITYFPGVSIANYVTVLVCWLLFGVLCLAMGAWHEKRQKLQNSQDMTNEGLHDESQSFTKDGLSEEIEEELEENVAPA